MTYRKKLIEVALPLAACRAVRRSGPPIFHSSLCKGRSKTAAGGGRLIRGITHQHGTFGKSLSLLPAPRPAFSFPRRFRGLCSKDSPHFRPAQFPRGNQGFPVAAFGLGLRILP